MWNSPQPQSLNWEIVWIDGVIYIGAAPPTRMIYALSAADGTLLRSIEVPFDGAQVIGVTDGVLIARSGVNLVALSNRS